jgi:hypothetical protein
MLDFPLQGDGRLPQRLDFRENVGQVLFQHPAAFTNSGVPSAT